MASIKKRAVSTEQKEQRRQDILASACELFVSTNDYDSLLMKHIAENISLTKGTLYLYFKTKEEVFLALYTREFNARFDALDTAFQLIAQNLSSTKKVPSYRMNVMEHFLCAVTENIMLQQTFLRLNALLHTVLEKNIDFETALTFKTLLRDRLLATGVLVESSLPFLNATQGAELLLTMHELMIGCFHVSSPTPCLEEVFNRPDMAFMKLDFVQEFTKSLYLILLGLERKNEMTKGK